MRFNRNLSWTGEDLYLSHLLVFGEERGKEGFRLLFPHSYNIGPDPEKYTVREVDLTGERKGKTGKF